MVERAWDAIVESAVQAPELLVSSVETFCVGP